MHVYDIDTRAWCIHHLETFTAGGDMRYQSLQGDVLIYSWRSWRSGRVFVAIKTIYPNNNLIEELIMNLDVPYQVGSFFSRSSYVILIHI